MPKNIVICLDGTGNEFGVNLTNVLKLYRMLEKTDDQVVFYDPGVGTMGLRDSWGRLRQTVRSVLGLASGYGLDDEVLGAYRFLAEHYREGDQIFLFGFSRGAYSVRALSGFIYLIGLMRTDQLNYLGYAYGAYKGATTDKRGLGVTWHFRSIAGGQTVPIRFVGTWDSVASIIVPRPDRFYIPSLEVMPYTHQNPGVAVFRHAVAIDEFRRMFRLFRWKEGQVFKPDHFSTDQPPAQDSAEVWFAGCHSDIGGGYPEDESGLSKFPLRWMIQQAKAHGLRVNNSMYQHLVEGEPRAGGTHDYVRPDPAAELHDSVTGIWRMLEWLPKRAKWKDWPDRRGILGYYLPRREPRFIPDGARIHDSVLERRKVLSTYRPQNLPATYQVEP